MSQRMPELEVPLEILSKVLTLLIRKLTLSVGDAAGCARAELDFMLIPPKQGQGYFSIQGYMKAGAKYGTQMNHQFHLNMW